MVSLLVYLFKLNNKMIYQLIIFLLFITYFYYIGKRYNPRLKYHISFAFIIKCLAGVLFTYTFSNLFGDRNLTADADVFIKDSQTLFRVATVNFFDFIKLLFTSNDYLVSTYLSDTTHWDSSSGLFINDSRFIIRFHALVHFISLGNISIHIMATNFISLIGILCLTKSLGFLTRLPSLLCFYLLVLSPNFLFWSSSLLKEPFIIYGIGLTLWSLTHIHNPFKKGILFSMGLALVFIVKFYIGFCFLGALLIYNWFKYVPAKIASITFASTLLLGTILLFTPIGKKPLSKISRVQFDFNNIGKGGIHVRADSCIYVIPGEEMKFINRQGDSIFLTTSVEGEFLPPNAVGKPTKCTIEPNSKPWIYYDDGVRSNSYIETNLILDAPKQLLKNIPQALSISLLRPFPNDPPFNEYKWLSILDTIWMYSFLLYCIYNKRLITSLENNAIIGFLFFAITLALIIGWTTPVLGAVIRYRIPIQLGIICIGAILLDPNKIPFLKLVKRPKSK